MAGLSLSGLASGVDTAGIVDQLMALERQKLTAIGYRKAAVGGQQTALKEVGSKLAALKDAALALSADSTWAQKQTVESSEPTRVAVSMLAGAGIGGTSISVDRLASSAQRRFEFGAGSFDGDGKTTVATTLSLAYDDGTSAVTIDIAAGSTKKQIADAINARTSGPAVAAVVNTSQGERLVVSARKTGEKSEFTMSSSSGVLAEDALFVRPPKADLRAAFRVNGGAVDYSESNIVEHAVPGVRLTFKGVTSSAATVTVSENTLDRDGIKAKIKSFVDAYNAVVDTTRGKLTEQATRNPTSDFQAARGQLFGDSGLTSMLSRLRQDMAEVVTTAGVNDLGDLGVAIPRATSTSSADAKAGKLVLDEAKLSAALDTDFTAVKSFLATFSKDVETFVKAQTTSIDDRVKSGDGTAKRIQAQIDRTNERIDAREKRLKAQFAAMEAALQNSQTQGAWLAGQIAGLPKAGSN
jgi:flagellar hook-associated protein 2